MPNINILSVFILILSSILMTMPVSYAETSSTMTSRINAVADVYVEQNNPNENFEGTFHNYAGYTGINGSVVSYLKFDITSIPRSNLMHDIVIDSAKLRLLTQSVNGSTSTTFVTVSYCNNSAWIPSNISREKRVCSNPSSLKGVDSVVVHDNFLPDVYSWDILEGVIRATEAGLPKITFTVTSFPLTPKPLPYPSPGSSSIEPIGFITFWSSEKAGFGFSAAPLLMISYTIKDSIFATSLYFMLSAVLPTLAIIVPAMLWVYRKTKGQRKMQVDKV